MAIARLAGTLTGQEMAHMLQSHISYVRGAQISCQVQVLLPLYRVCSLHSPMYVLLITSQGMSYALIYGK